MSTAKIGHKVETKGQYKNEYVMIPDVTLYYASILEPKLKYQDKVNKEYSLTAFVSGEQREKLEAHTDDGGLFFNKEFAEVGVDKNKKRKIKYETEKYELVEGMHGVSLTKDAKTKAGKAAFVKVIDTQGKPWPKDKLIGNGSKAKVKLFGYRNQDGQLVVTLDTIMITDHVEYTGGGDGEVFDDMLGVTITRETTPEQEAVDEFAFEEDDAQEGFVADEDESDY